VTTFSIYSLMPPDKFTCSITSLTAPFHIPPVVVLFFLAKALFRKILDLILSAENLEGLEDCHESIFPVTETYF